MTDMADVILFALWLALAASVGLNWRAQIAWQRYYEKRLGPDGITKSPVITSKGKSLRIPEDWNVEAIGDALRQGAVDQKVELRESDLEKLAVALHAAGFGLMPPPTR